MKVKSPAPIGEDRWRFRLIISKILRTFHSHCSTMSSGNDSDDALALANGIKPRVSPVESRRASRPAESYKAPIDRDGLSWPCTHSLPLKSS